MADHAEASQLSSRVDNIDVGEDGQAERPAERPADDVLFRGFNGTINYQSPRSKGGKNPITFSHADDGEQEGQGQAAEEDFTPRELESLDVTKGSEGGGKGGVQGPAEVLFRGFNGTVNYKSPRGASHATPSFTQSAGEGDEEVDQPQQEQEGEEEGPKVSESVKDDEGHGDVQGDAQEAQTPPCQTEEPLPLPLPPLDGSPDGSGGGGDERGQDGGDEGEEEEERKKKEEEEEEEGGGEGSSDSTHSIETKTGGAEETRTEAHMFSEEGAGASVGEGEGGAPAAEGAAEGAATAAAAAAAVAAGGGGDGAVAQPQAESGVVGGAPMELSGTGMAGKGTAAESGEGMAVEGTAVDSRTGMAVQDTAAESGVDMEGESTTAEGGMGMAVEDTAAEGGVGQAMEGTAAEGGAGMAGDGTAAESATAEAEAAEGPTTSPRKVIALLSSYLSTLPQEVAQRRACDLFSGKGMDMLQLDAADPLNKELRDNLFSISGVRGKYPQLFIQEPDHSLTFVGGWEELESLVDMNDLPPGVLQQNPSIRTFDSVFRGVQRGPPKKGVLPNTWL